MDTDQGGQSRLLLAYDDQLREEKEAIGALSWDRDGPVVRAVFAGGSGFVTYRSLAGYDGPDDGPRLDQLIDRTRSHFEHGTDVAEFEWKTRGHDLPVDLSERLQRHGLIPAERETVMIGEARLLARDVPLPEGVALRRIGFDAQGLAEPEGVVRADLARVLAMQEAVFGSPGHTTVDHLVSRVLQHRDEVEVWAAEADGTVICAGRLERVPGTDFAGIWGGAAVPEWRGRGIYRALTAARARSALSMGAQYIQSDCTEFSRPILERSGLQAVTTTTPYVWTRPT